MAEFKHFSPIGPVTVKKLIPNFTGAIDVFDPRKNQAHFEEVAVNAGLGLVKGAILKNTLRFFETKASPKGEDKKFPAASSTSMPVLGHNALGFPVYSNLIIKGDTYRDNAGNVIAKFNDIRLDAVIIEVERENNVLTTDIQGRNGTVVEMVGSKSPKVRIRGTVFADIPGVYPEADVAELTRALACNKALRVESWFLAMFGIYNLFIKQDSIKQEEGSQEYQKFEFDSFADEPLILKLLPVKNLGTPIV